MANNMVSRRQQSSLSNNTPVRFYKVVALSFLFLTIVLLGIVIFMSSKRATITITTKPDPIDVSYDVAVSVETGSAELGAVVTTTITSLSQTFNPTGSKQIPGVSQGTVTLFNKTATAQVLIPTTRLLTASGTLFRLKDRVTVPANSSIETAAYADAAGAAGDIPASKFTIPGLPENKQTVIYAESSAPMTGGMRQVGILSDDDVKKAEKILVSGLEDKAKQSLASLYPNKKSLFSVLTKSIALEDGVKVGDEVAGFVLKGSATVLGIFYDESKVITAGETMLQKHAVSDADIVQPSKQAPTVTFGDYDAVKKVANVKVFYTGRAVLNPESKEIEKNILFGKTKDEVRRYLMSLKHVQSVEVEFHPAWMMTVPHVPDHVRVEVKNVE